MICILNILFNHRLVKQLLIPKSLEPTSHPALRADMADKNALGNRANSFTPHNSKLAHDMVTVVATVSLQEQEGKDTMVAAARPGASDSQHGASSSQRGGGSQRWSKKPGHSGNSGSGQQQATHNISPNEKTRTGSGLCFSHFCYGAKAKQCNALCNWSGN
jgi:hypothetical protein